MRRSQASSGVSVEILIKEEMIPPERIRLKLARGSEDRPLSLVVEGKDADEAVGDVLR
jgi:hypothetical protein